MIDTLLINAALSEGTGAIDIAIDNGTILEVGPNLAYEAEHRFDLAGHLLLPGFVESHLHLDIALMNDPHKPGRPQSFRSPVELGAVVEARRKQFTREDIEQRAGQALEMASRHGVTAMRAQCHVDREVGLKHLEALLAVREKYRQRVTLQIVTFPQQGLVEQPDTQELFREAIRLGANAIGCASNLDPLAATPEGVRRHIDTALALAIEMGVDLDMHADLGLPPRVALDELEAVYAARRAVATGYQGRVTAGHFCAVDSAEPDVAAQAMEWLRRAEMHVISQPDLYRLGREDLRSVRRGLTRVKQLLAAGVNVAFASNNVRDAYRPLGNFDLLEEGLILAYGAHMDTITELETLLRMCTENAARILRLQDYGIGAGKTADLVVLDAQTPSQALVNQSEKLLVFKRGRLVAENRRENNVYPIS